MPSGIICSIYRSSASDSSLRGLSATHTEVLLVLSEDDDVHPFRPSAKHPAVRLVKRTLRSGEHIIAVPDDPRYVNDKAHRSFGGTFIYSCDSRFSAAMGKIAGAAPVPLHDRYEKY